MAERRSLTEGLKPVPRSVEEAFVHNANPKPAEELPPPTRRTTVDRSPLTSRIRADLATALKRASLERQLNGVEPSAVQEILEEALEPWLRTHGYVK
jgi:hypothetical protein